VQSLKINLASASLWDPKRNNSLVLPTQKHCREGTGYFSSSAAQVPCLSLLSGVCTQDISACPVLIEQSIVRAESDVLSTQIAFHLLYKNKEFEREGGGNALVIRLIRTVRYINYLFSLIAAISIIIHKCITFERGCEKSPGFGPRPHCKAVQLAIHFHHREVLCLPRIISCAVLLSL